MIKSKKGLCKMIEGIGIDIIELPRIKKAIEKKNRFVERILTDKEQVTYNSLKKEFRKIEFLAGRFAAKEAFAKAIGTGIGALSFQHIEITSDRNGKPFINAEGFERKQIFLSISHSKTYAVAQVIVTE